MASIDGGADGGKARIADDGAARVAADADRLAVVKKTNDSRGVMSLRLPMGVAMR